VLGAAIKKKDPVFTNRHSVTFERNWMYINSAVRTPNIAVLYVSLNESWNEIGVKNIHKTGLRN